MKKYFVYILLCSDGTYYTGWTNDVEKRIHTHNHAKNGAKYTRARRPVKLIYLEEYTTLHEAMVRENDIKKLSRQAKDDLIKQKNLKGEL